MQGQEGNGFYLLAYELQDKQLSNFPWQIPHLGLQAKHYPSISMYPVAQSQLGVEVLLATQLVQ